MTQLIPSFQRVIELAVNTDLNTVREGGFYLARSPVNAPLSNHNYVLIVYAVLLNGRRNTVQVLIDTATGATSTRTDTGSWQASGGGGGSSDAEEVAYDNLASGLTAEDVQAAIDELKELLDTSSNVTNLSTDRDATTVTVENTSGDDAVLPAATGSLAGVMTGADKAKLDGITAGAQPNVATNLTFTRDGSTLTVESNTGSDAILPAATTSLAGLLTATDKVKLNGIEAGATADMTGAEIVSAITSQLGSSAWQTAPPTGTQIVDAIDAELGSDDWQTGGAAQNLSKSNNTTTVTVGIDGGGTSATLTAADASNAGIMTAAQASKLAGIETGATGDQTGAEIVAALDTQLSGTGWRDTTPTNLGTSRNATQVVVTNTAGDDATLAAADGSNAGVMTAADKVKLDGIEAGAEVNPTGAAIVSAIDSELGSTAWQDGGGGSGAGTVTVRLIAVADLSVANDLDPGASLDGVTIVDGDRILLIAQAGGAANGIYTASSDSVRSSGYTTWDDLVGLQVIVLEGDDYAGTTWINTNAAGGTIDTTPVEFVQTAATPTNLSVNRSNIAVTINSSTGDSAAIAAADGSNAGVMTAAMQVKLASIASGAQVNDPTDITISRNGTTVTVNSSTGADGAISAADGSNAGVMTSAMYTKLDGIEAGAQITDLSATHEADEVVIHSSDGDDVTINAATDTTAGVMVADDKAKLDTIEEGAQRTDITTQHNASSVNIISSDGDDGTINAATTSVAGVMSAADKTKLDGIEAGAQLTDISISHAATDVTVISSDGTDGVINAADSSNAGVMTAADKIKLDGIEANSTGDMTGAEIVAAIDAELGDDDWQGGGAGGGDAVDIDFDPTGTAFTATDVQAALEETSTALVANAGNISAVAAEAGFVAAYRVQAASTANVASLASDLQNGDTLDGVTLSAGQLVLLKNQSDPTENGIYVVNTGGTRWAPESGNALARWAGVGYFVVAGDTNKNKLFINTNLQSHVYGSDDVTFAEFTSGGGSVAAEDVTFDDTDTILWTVSDVQAAIEAAHDGILSGAAYDSEAPNTASYRVKCATFTNINLVTGLEVGDTIDGYTLASGDLVLVRSQTEEKDNGIYVAGTAGARWAPATGDDLSRLSGVVFHVQRGTNFEGRAFKCTNRPNHVFGVDDVTFAEWSPQVSAGVTYNESDILITFNNGNTFSIFEAAPGTAGLLSGPLYSSIVNVIDVQEEITDRIEALEGDSKLVKTYPAYLASTADVDLATFVIDGGELDSTPLSAGDLVLIKDQADPVENGLYVVQPSGDPPVRFSWAVTPPAYNLRTPAMLVTVQNGVENATTIWMCDSTSPVTPGSTAHTFVKVFPAEGGGSGNLSDDTYANLTAGFSATAYDNGTMTTGTLEVDPEDGNFQRVVNNGAFTLAVPTHANDYQILLFIENDSSAGAITPGAFDLIDGNDFNTTNDEVFFAQITKLNGFTTLTVKNVTTPSSGDSSAEDIAYDNSTSSLTATNVQDAIDEVVAEAVMNSDYDANSILAATSDNTPVVLSVGASTFVGRKATGDISAMSASEARTVLNVENGATADQSAAEILAALLTVDGSGSGLDADTLDGVSSASFVRHDTTANFSKGYTTTAYNVGTLTSGTTTLDVTNGQYQKCVCNGAITIEPPTASGAYSMILEITMGASAGTITMDGSWNEINGVDFTTTEDDVFYVQIFKFEDFVQATITQVGSGGGGSGNLSDDTYANLTAGFSATAHNLGTMTTGTLEVDPEDGNFQRVINNGAFTLAAPTHANDYTILLVIENDTSAGAITPDGFTLVDGNSFTTTDNEIFFAQITKLNGTTTLTVKNVTTPSTGEGGDADSVTYDNSVSSLTATTVQDAIDEVVAEAVMESAYDANTILAATTDNTPVALTVGASTFVGRKATGDISAMSASEARTILNVENGATADMTGAEIVSAIDTQLGGSTWQGGGGGSSIIVPPQGRLTPTSGTPVITTNTTAQTTLYYEPYVGTFCPIYNGSAWEMKDFASALSLALDSNSGNTGYQQSGKNFDVFYAYVSGVYYFGTGPAWTDDTTRSAALARVKGVWVNNATMTLKHGSSSGNTVSVPSNQATYLGTIRATANGQTGINFGGSGANGVANTGLYIWNLYNQTRMVFNVSDSTDSWSYTTASWRAANASNDNRVNFVKGILGNAEEANYLTSFIPATASADNGVIAIGLDSTSTPAGHYTPSGSNPSSSAITEHPHYAKWSGHAAIGFHYVQAMEYGHSGGGTFKGDSGGLSSAGLSLSVFG